MPSSYTISCRFTLQATGENNNTWGNILNAGVFALVDSAISGRLAFALSGPKTLTTANGATDEARMAMLDVTGGTGGAITLPPVSKGYFVRNAASGDVTLGAGGAVATLKPGDVQPVFSDGAVVYNLKIAGQTLQAYITSQITGSGNLPPPVAGDIGKALIVVAGPTWAPGFIGAAQLAVGAVSGNLGYTPANVAGDTFTGPVAATVIYASNARMSLSADANISNAYMDLQNNSVFQYNISTGALIWYSRGVNKWQVDNAGNQIVPGNSRAVSFGVNGQQFNLNSDNASYSNIFLNGSTCYLQYTWGNGLLNYVVNGVSCFTVDAGGNAAFRGSVSGNFILGGGTVGTGQLQDGAVTTAKLADSAVTNPKIANGAVNNWHIQDNAITAGKIGAQQVGSQHLYPGSAVANIGYQPLNKAGDVCSGAFTANGQLYGIGGVFAGSGGRIAMGTDNSTYSRLYLDQANGNYIHCNWNTGKVTFYHGNVATMSVTPQGVITAYNFVIGNP